MSVLKLKGCGGFLVALGLVCCRQQVPGHRDSTETRLLCEIRLRQEFQVGVIYTTMVQLSRRCMAILCHWYTSLYIFFFMSPQKSIQGFPISPTVLPGVLSLKPDHYYFVFHYYSLHMMISDPCLKAYTQGSTASPKRVNSVCISQVSLMIHLKNNRNQNKHDDAKHGRNMMYIRTTSLVC